MRIQTDRQLQNAQRKLKLLEDRLRQLDQVPAKNARTRELTIRSLKQLANQIKEEIVVYSARRTATAS